MNTENKTLWMGNIEAWMNQKFIKSIFEEIGIYPYKITLKNTSAKRGCAFVEFHSNEEAKEVLRDYNGKRVQNLDIKLNWVRTLNDKILTQKKIKFTLFIGNVDKTIDESEVKNYFCSKYKSIISVKLIKGQDQKRNKGYGFIEFQNFKEFQEAINYKGEIIFGNQKIVFNSAKNRYEDYEIDEIKLKESQIKEDSFNDSHSDISSSSNLMNNESTAHSFNSNKSEDCFTTNSIELNSPKDIYDEENNIESLNACICESLKTMVSSEYFLCKNYNVKISNICNYYCSNLFCNNKLEYKTTQKASYFIKTDVFNKFDVFNKNSSLDSKIFDEKK